MVSHSRLRIIETTVSLRYTKRSEQPKTQFLEGSAASLRSQGARLMVTEIDPTCALQGGDVTRDGKDKRGRFTRSHCRDGQVWGHQPATKPKVRFPSSRARTNERPERE